MSQDSHFQGPICRGGWGGVEPPKEFFDPPSQCQFELLWGGSILTPPVHIVTCLYIWQGLYYHGQSV